MLQEEFDRVGRGLPHGRLMQWEIAHGVGRGCSVGECFEEGIDDIRGGLEGAGGVEREVAAIVGEGCFFWELWGLTLLHLFIELVFGIVAF